MVGNKFKNTENRDVLHPYKLVGCPAPISNLALQYELQ